ncbi:MAG: FAD:protein FMN transferase [Gammaproteobacteria bacterium]
MVAIRSPDGGDEALAKLEMTGGALASSGDYERYFEINGIRYGHILNPSTGWPVSGLSAVSVIAEHCIVAGSLATIAMLKGRTGTQWLERQHIAFLSCTSDGQTINQLQ